MTALETATQHADRTRDETRLHPGSPTSYPRPGQGQPMTALETATQHADRIRDETQLNPGSTASYPRPDGNSR